MEPIQNNNFEINLEAEIAQLSREIADKRKQLAEQRGVVEEDQGERELVRDVLRERIMTISSSASGDDDETGSVSATPLPTKAVKPDHDYLENLDRETVVRVNELISELSKNGLDAAIRIAQGESANVLDAFHDTLVNRLYEDLKGRGLVK